MQITATNDNPIRTGTRSHQPAKHWCECGNEKRRGAEACARCVELDGPTLTKLGAGRSNTLLALRDADYPLTLSALARESRICERQLLRILRDLLAEGVVTKLVDGRPVGYGEGKGARAEYILRGRYPHEDVVEVA